MKNKIIILIGIFLVLLPLAFADVCIRANGIAECRNAVEKVVPFYGVTPLSFNWFDGTPGSCSSHGGTPGTANQNDFSQIAECIPGCYCNSMGSILGPDTTGATDFTQLGSYADCNDACNNFPSNTCGLTTYDPAIQGCCAQITIYSTADGEGCCWDGSISTQTRQCPARPAGNCALDKTITAPCLCNNQPISQGACCTGGRQATSGAACTTSPTQNLCGNGVKDAGEDCDVKYSGGTPVTGTPTNVQCRKTDGSVDPNQICSALCKCVTVPSSTGCNNGECDVLDIACRQPVSTDCPAPPGCTNPSAMPSWNQKPTFTAPNKVSFSWTASTECTDQTVDYHQVQYRIQRGRTPTDAVNNPDRTFPPQALTAAKEFTDTLDDATMNSATVLYYALMLDYGNQHTVIKTLSKVSEQVNLPNKDCPVASFSYCKQDGNNEIAVKCDSNFVATTKTCDSSSTNPQVCLVRGTGVNAVADCYAASTQCNDCNGYLASFPDGDKQISEFNGQNVHCQYAQTCYKDYANTTIPLYMSCRSASSCLSYKTQEACAANWCKKPSGPGSNDCNWQTIVPGIGVCLPLSPSFSNCNECALLGPFCTQQTCTQIDTNCQYVVPDDNRQAISMPPGTRPAGVCYDKSAVPCEYLTTQKDCVGDPVRNFVLNLHTNLNTVSSSDDILLHGKCAWINNQCNKDSNNNGIPDRLNSEPDGGFASLTRAEMDKLLLNFTNPVTNILNSSGLTYSAKFSIDFNSDGALKVCFRTAGNTALCNDPVDSTQFTTNTNVGKINYNFRVGPQGSSNTDDGNWEMLYYAEGKSLNLEPVRIWPFSIDGFQPVIQNIVRHETIINQNGKYTLDVRFFFDTTEVSKCTTVLYNQSSGLAVSKEDKGIPRGSTLPDGSTPPDPDITNLRGNHFSVHYPGVVTGNYHMEITCVDEHNNYAPNPLSPEQDFRVDNDYSIHLVTPPDSLFTVTSMPVTITTLQDATCKYGTRGQTYAQMPNTYNVTGGKEHKVTLTNLHTGLYTYQTACNIGGTIVYGDRVDDVNFTIDITPPYTQVCSTTNNCSYNFSVANETFTPSLNCTKQLLPLRHYTCDKNINIKWCLQKRTDSDCTPIFQPTINLGLLNYQDVGVGTQGMKIRYQSVDAGGNIEPINWTYLNITDLTPPDRPLFNITPKS